MKVNLGEVDEENPVFGGRIIKIGNKISTPYRIPSSVEYISKQQVPSTVSINSDISEITMNFRTNEYDQFVNENGPFDNRMSSIEEKADLMSYSPFISFYPQLPKNIIPDEKGMFLLLKLGLSVKKVNIISIPQFETSTTFENDLERYCEHVRSYSKEPMPILDMGLPQREFKDKFNKIVSNRETDLIKVVGLIYRNWRKNIQNFYHIWDNKKKNILYYCLDVQRTYENKAATMHILQSFGVDVYSTKFLRGGGGNYQKKIRDVDIFDNTNIGVLRVNEYFQEHSDHSMNCNCPLCHGRTLDEFIEKYGYDDNGELSGSQLQYAGKVHEFFSSENEFSISRQHIQENSLLEYFESKKYLQNQKRDPGTPMV